MTRPSTQEVTQLLQAWGRGDQAALDRLVPLVHDELRRLARRHMRGERAGHILQTTALVNEAYLRLVDASRVRWQDRRHFFAIAAKLMRQVLVHYARVRGAQKRGGALRQVSLDEGALLAPEREGDLIVLEDALNALEGIDPRKARIVELRFFGGLSLEETGEVLNLSADTVWRDWDLAKAWLHREMSHPSR